MDRLGSSLVIAAALSLPFVACGEDPTPGGGTGGETETGSSGSTSSASNTMTGSSMTNMTMGGTSGSSGTSNTGVDSTGNDTTTTVDPTTTTTTGADECGECIAENCDGELGDCGEVPDCQCWVDCLTEGNEPPTCGMMCNGMPPEEFQELVVCIDGNCDAECNGGGGSSGGLEDETYQECIDDADCPLTDCSGFLGYCSVDCMGDDGSCPMPATGNIMPICGGMMDNRCLLPCGGGGDTCPDGMICQMGGGGNEICIFDN